MSHPNGTAKLVEDATTAAAQISGDLKARVERNPYGMIAAAVGVGYVLGGGLFTPTTARLIQLGIKLAAVPPIRDGLIDLAESALDGVLQTTQAPKP